MLNPIKGGYIDGKKTIVDGFVIPDSMCKKWSKITIECHERQCVCMGCKFSSIESQRARGKCRVKYFVRALILNGIYPPKEEEKEL